MSLGRGALIGLALVAGGCAAHRTGGLAEKLVRQNDGATNGATFDAPGADRPLDTHKDPPARWVPVPKSSAGETIETWDPALQRALVALARAPAAAADLNVAAEYRRLRVYDSAVSFASKVLKADPRNAAAFDDLARTWRDAGMPDLALPNASRAVYFAPDSAEAHNTLGTVFSALGDDALARKEFERAVALAPDAMWARCNLRLLSGGSRQQTASEAPCPSEGHATGRVPTP